MVVSTADVRQAMVSGSISAGGTISDIVRGEKMVRLAGNRSICGVLEDLSKCLCQNWRRLWQPEIPQRRGFGHHFYWLEAECLSILAFLALGTSSF